MGLHWHSHQPPIFPSSSCSRAIRCGTRALRSSRTTCRRIRQLTLAPARFLILLTAYRSAGDLPRGLTIMVSVDSSLRRLKLSSGKSGMPAFLTLSRINPSSRIEPVAGQLRACPTISKFVPFAPFAGQCVNDSDASKSPASRRYRRVSETSASEDA